MSDNEQKHDPKMVDLLKQAEKRQMFVDGLCEKAMNRPLTREEAFFILQGILADMLSPMLPNLFEDAEKAEGHAKTNARLMAEIALGMRDEMLAFIDKAITEHGILVVPSMTEAFRKVDLQ